MRCLRALPADRISHFASKIYSSLRGARYHAWENLQPVSSAGKHAPAAKRGKTCTCCQARENMHLLPSAGKRTPSSKHMKTYTQSQARENIPVYPMPRAGKHAVDARHGEKCCLHPFLFFNQSVYLANTSHQSVSSLQ